MANLPWYRLTPRKPEKEAWEQVKDVFSSQTKAYKEVLKNAMKNLTNGLPVFVATSDTLDTEDNLKLYDEIRQYEDLVDARFTMIVVNKADKAKLPKGGFDQEQIDDILRQAIPKKMYSFGIYYVSSVMGLGAKIEKIGRAHV